MKQTKTFPMTHQAQVFANNNQLIYLIWLKRLIISLIFYELPMNTCLKMWRINVKLNWLNLSTKIHINRFLKWVSYTTPEESSNIVNGTKEGKCHNTTRLGLWMEEASIIHSQTKPKAAYLEVQEGIHCPARCLRRANTDILQIHIND